jgi:hypothetical protein
MALYTVVFLGSTPIGGTLAGWVGQHLGPRVGLAGGGVIDDPRGSRGSADPEGAQNGRAGSLRETAAGPGG